LTDRVKNRKKVLYRGKEGRNILLTVNRRKTNWIGHINLACELAATTYH